MPDFISLPIDINNLPAGTVFNNFGYAELAGVFNGSFDNDNFNRDGAGPNAGQRMLIPSAQISISGSKIRVHMRAPAVGTLTVKEVWVGHQGVGNAWNFDGTQVCLQFSSVAGFTISNGATLISDEVDYPIDASKNLVVSFGLGSPAATPVNDTNATGLSLYSKANSSSEAGDTAPTGYNLTSNRIDIVFEVSVEQFPTGSPAVPTLATDSGGTFDLDKLFIYSDTFAINTDIIVEQFRGGGVIRTFSLNTTPNAFGGFPIDALLSGTALPTATTIDIDAGDLFKSQLASDGTEERGSTGLFIEGTFATPSDPALESDVRSGVVYNNGTLTGTAAIPAKADTRSGTPVDDGVGTLAVVPADDTRFGVPTDDTVGNYVPADEDNHALGDSYGSDGTEFTGTKALTPFQLPVDVVLEDSEIILFEGSE